MIYDNNDNDNNNNKNIYNKSTHIFRLLYPTILLMIIPFNSNILLPIPGNSDPYSITNYCIFYYQLDTLLSCPFIFIPCKWLYPLILLDSNVLFN